MKKAIYGAGEFGKRLFKILKLGGEKIDIFVQTNLNENINIEGIDVISYKDFIEIEEPYLVYIAINDEKTVENIKDRFRTDNFDMSKVLNMQSFIKQNYDLLFEIGDKKCLLCGHSVTRFLPGGEKNDIFLKKNIIGGGYRENAICPICGSLDRTRWVYWVLKNFTNLFMEENRVIHFAPEIYLRKQLEENKDCDYYPVDIKKMSGGAKVHRVDITSIPFIDNFADYIIVNHVLEHIPDEKTAVSEMKRVLKEKGKIVMSFPISIEENTFEDNNITTDEQREKYYGQKDHVRLYGRDFKKHFESYGFQVDVYSPKDYMELNDIKKYGLLENDTVLICSKKE